MRLGTAAIGGCTAALPVDLAVLCRRASRRSTLIDSTSPPGARTEVMISVAPGALTLVTSMSPLANSHAPCTLGPATNSTVPGVTPGPGPTYTAGSDSWPSALAAAAVPAVTENRYRPAGSGSTWTEALKASSCAALLASVFLLIGFPMCIGSS